MTDTEYLNAVLRDQTFAPGCDELKTLQEHRKEVEQLLLKHFEESTPTIKYGGSRAKGTMIKESYDLDVVCYFPRDDNAAGENLKEIYENTETALRGEYFTERKTSAIRLKDPKNFTDFHIDVVPGRYVDGDDGVVFLYQSSGDKDRLKTNPEKHIEHVRDSGLQDPIKLMKLWRVRNGIAVKTFALELLVIELLKHRKKATLPNQLLHVFTTFRDDKENLSIEDPANPSGNDLSELLNETVKSLLSSAAATTLRQIEGTGWKTVFGPVPEEDRTAALENIAISIPAASRQKPWAGVR